jgi:hypothetical protein
MIISSKDLCLVPRLWLVALFVLLVVSLVLNLIVAVGNWKLYSRVERIESTLGLPAMPQSPQTTSQRRQPKNPVSKSNAVSLDD